MLLPLTDLQGEMMHELAETNTIHGHSLDGGLELQDILSSGTKSGTADVHLKLGWETTVQNDHCQGAVYDHTKYHQETQTAIYTFHGWSPSARENGEII